MTSRPTTPKGQYAGKVILEFCVCGGGDKNSLL
jgi:hypothetical protein